MLPNQTLVSSTKISNVTNSPLSLSQTQAHSKGNSTSEDSNSKYPCGTCDRPVSWSERAVECNTCGQWFHLACQSLPSCSTEYERLGDSEVVWRCAVCDNANYSTVAFDLFGLDAAAPRISTECDTNHSHLLSPTELSVNSVNEFKPIHSSTPTRASRQNKKLNRPLRLLNINFQSITGKKAEFLNLIDSTKPDIIIGTETWIDDNIFSSELFPSYFTPFREDRNRDGGGVFVIVANHLTSEKVDELSVEGCELKWVKITLKGRRQLLVAAYYRPNANDKESLLKFEASVRRASNIKNATVIIGGDFNFPSFDWTTKTLKTPAVQSALHYQFLDLIHDAGLEQLVTFPTRNENTLDLFLTSHPALAPRIEPIPGLSDHDIPYLEFDVNPVYQHPPKRAVPQYSKADWSSLHSSAHELSLSVLEAYDASSDAEQLWQTLKVGIASMKEKHIPNKTIGGKNNKPWVDYATLKMIRRRDRLYKRWKKSGNPDIRLEMRKLKYAIQRNLRRSYWAHTENMFRDSIDGKPGTNKKFWTYIKALRSEAASVAPLKKDGRLVTDAKERADMLNNQFRSAFSPKFTCNKKDFTTRTGLPADPPPDSPTCSNINITETGVIKLLKNLDPNKAPGPDGISPRLLRELAEDLAPAFTLLFQCSLHTGIVPDDWRTANVTPVFKKGERYRPENYRPISLTSVACKLMEHIITSTVMNFAEKNKIITEAQHGFRRQRSCESQLIGLVDDLSANLECRTQTDALIMDFSKAFDKVCHTLLLHKLRSLGITGKIHAWIQSFLTNRQQAVVVDGAVSNLVPVESGVPQGSVLGPSLFILYINDLPAGLSSTARLFADDTLCHKAISSTNDQDALQEDLNCLAEWEEKWLMSFHPDKCQALRVCRKRNPTLRDYSLRGHTLETVRQAKYLGITITSDLNWGTHISNVSNQANRTLGLLRRNLKVGSQFIKKQAYVSLVRPKLEYASSVWDPYTDKDISRLEAVQRRAARWVTHRHRKTSSVNALLKSLKWPSLADRRRKARLLNFYKYHNGTMIINSRQCPIPNPSETKVTRKQHSASYHLPSCKTLYRQKSFFPRTISDWNNLPAEVALSTTLEGFKSGI